MSPGSTDLLPQAFLSRNLPAPPTYEVVGTRVVYNENATKSDIGEYLNDGKDLSTTLKTVHTVSSTDIELTANTGGKDQYIVSRACGPQFRNGWKPVTLRYPVLSCFIVISLSLAAILEVLSRYSTGNDNENGGGLAFAAGVDSLSATSSFFYLYFPTVVAVVYSTLWSWVDLDAKRLEPWFQLSQPNGATAEASLLLHYPTEFLALVPIRALRLRQWTVLLAGLITMVIFWAITPLQSAIFTTGIVTRTRPSLMAQTGSLLPLNFQSNALNTNFMNDAFAITWLGQKMPPYTTADYALQPFAPSSHSSVVSSTEIWSASTIAYNTKLNCKPANITLQAESSSTYIFDDGDGCIVPDIALPSTSGIADFMVLYIPYWDNAIEDYSLFNSKCSNSTHKFLALWASGSSEYRSEVYSNITALFCEPNYFVQTVNAEINATDFSVINSTFDEHIGNVNNMLSKDIFNITSFEYIIGTGVSSIDERRDYHNTVVLEQFPRLRNYSLTWPVSNMVGFAVAANRGNVEEMSKPTVLQASFEKAHKLLLSTAISTLTSSSPNNSQSDAWNGLIRDQPAAIILVRPFAITIEVILLVVAVSVAILWWLSHSRPSKLASDPANIADIMHLVCDSKEITDLFADDGNLTMQLLEERLRNRRFLLSTISSGGGKELILHILPSEIVNSENGEDATAACGGYRLPKKPQGFVPVLPIELRLFVGTPFILAIVVAICLLISLRSRIVEVGGLQRFSANTIILTFVENVLPTAFASFLEPLWVVLNRLLCVLQPFEDLRIGNAKASTTIYAKYTSLPPQLTFWRALRSRHFILAGVCAIAISTNALAVTLSVVFNEAPVPVTINITSKPTLTVPFNGSTHILSGNTRVPITPSDHFHIIISNIADGTSLPPWTDNNFFYLPFELPSTAPQYISSSQGDPQLNQYSALTRGFGATARCQPLIRNAADNGIVFETASTDSGISFYTRHIIDNNASITCVNWGDGSGRTILNSSFVPDTPSAIEYVNPLMALGNSSSDYDPVVGGYGFRCGQFMVFGWARMGAAVPNGTSIQNGTNGRPFDYTFMSCQTRLITIQSIVSVDQGGHVLSATAQGPIENDTTIYSTTNETASLLNQINMLIGPQSTVGPIWHNDSFTNDWFNSVLKVYLNSSRLVDPFSQLPDSHDMVPIVEEMYQRLSAALIGLNAQIFTSPSSSNSTLPATVAITETRIFMDPTMFFISLTILILHLLAAIIYYTNRPQRFLPRMPTTVASLIAYVSMSHAVNDVRTRTKGATSHILRTSARYSYGKFVGVDGKSHLGIERSSKVNPVVSENVDLRRRKMRSFKTLFAKK